jgi:hypothetical protein
MKKAVRILFLVFALTSCDTFGYAPQPFPVWTAIPSRTPAVVTATPIILTLPFTDTPTIEIATQTPVPPTNTATPVVPSETPTLTPAESVRVNILGCNTSIDISHGMGEVTNAFVTIQNIGSADLPNTCALLRAIDEDREHPDKKVCVPNLPAQSQVTLKLTVDSAYKQDTIIQVDTTSNDLLLLRIDKQSCTDIGLFGGEPGDVGETKPIVQ